MSTLKTLLSGSIFVALCTVFVPNSHAVINIGGTGSLGSYSGTFAYSAADPNNATLTVFLTNTSPLANSGYITAFAFNNPMDKISGVSLSATDSDFSVIGGPSFDDSVNGAPNGQFDIGTSTGGGFTGGGQPQLGIAVNASETFTFTLAGVNLDTLSEALFFTNSSLSEGTGSGEGYENFVVRFRGFADGGSDKVPGVPTDPDDPVIPEPATMLLFGTGMAGAMIRKFKKA